MTKPFKKASRLETFNRLSEVARETVGDETPLDAAFAAFEGALEGDPEGLRRAQARLRALLLPDGPVTH